ncbi:MAG: hypothetical protein ACK5YR_21445 [Pirellula sp.]
MFSPAKEKCLPMVATEHIEPVFAKSILWTHNYYAKILETGGIYIADSVEQFAEAMNLYESNLGADRIGREAIVSQQLGKQGGKSGVRTAHKLLELARSNWR